jgi:hypothetical protein
MWSLTIREELGPVNYIWRYKRVLRADETK